MPDNYKTIREITTIGGTTYRLPDKSAPQLWEARLTVQCLNEHGVSQHSSIPLATCFLERQKLVEHGIVNGHVNDKAPADKPLKTAEDLLLELLAHIGVYPAE